MTHFYFPDHPPLKLEVIKINAEFDKDLTLLVELKNHKDVALKNVILVKSQLTVYLEESLLFMQKNNLIPDLPKIVNIKYINTSTQEILFTRIKNILGYKPAQYNFPASTNVYDGTIYVSNYYQPAFEHDSTINKLKMQFTGNLKQTLEYSFFHELGHLFLIEKNKDKLSDKTDSFSKVLKLNIEEAFAEAFAIHMICLKYPELPLKTDGFNYFHENSLELSEVMAKKFYYTKYNLSQKTFINTFIKLLKKQPLQIEEMFNPYEFPLVYKNSPFKDVNGNFITDMNLIFEKCFETALNNNKEVILNKTANLHTIDFKQKILERLQEITQNKSNSFEELADSLHCKVKNSGFLNKKIQDMRQAYLSNKRTINKSKKS